VRLSFCPDCLCIGKVMSPSLILGGWNLRNYGCAIDIGREVYLSARFFHLPTAFQHPRPFFDARRFEGIWANSGSFLEVPLAGDCGKNGRPRNMLGQRKKSRGRGPATSGKPSARKPRRQGPRSGHGDGKLELAAPGVQHAQTNRTSAPQILRAGWRRRPKCRPASP